MGILLSMIIGGLFGACIGAILGISEVRKQLQKDDAFYGEVTRVQPKTVTIKEIDEEGDVMQQVRLKSDEGISDDLYKGQIIFA